MKKENNKEFTQIGNILPDLLESFHRGANMEMMKIWGLWDSTMGKAVSENAQPAAFKGDLLLVHVTSSTWLQQLQFLKKDIIQKLNQAEGQELVRDIKFKIGPL